MENMKFLPNHKSDMGKEYIYIKSMETKIKKLNHTTRFFSKIMGIKPIEISEK